MKTCHKVLDMLLPNSEYVMRGETYDSITFISGETITEEQFEAGFAQYDAWKAEQVAAKAQAKASAESKLAALNLTTDDLKALGL
jgi:hypothetical protein